MDEPAVLGGPQPLIAALLVRPRTTADLVSRPRLLRVLARAARGPITIVSGEPGAGKTSLTTDWLDSIDPDRPLAWLTIRPNLDDPVTFWRYLLAAVDSLGIETSDLRLALEDDEPPGDRWLTELANRLSYVQGEAIIVLDDFHDLESAYAVETLGTLLDRAPTNVHFIILTRVEPPWHLPGWRMSGRVTEIDSRDLRYTADEVQELMDSNGIELGHDNLLLLSDRTEGWAGGLRLALLSMRRSPDPSAFIARFAVDNELVSSYLLREVLDRQPADMRQFLLDISILDEITADTCDLLRERDDSREFLDRCLAENLFLTQLVGPISTFHLHDLVSELLRATLVLEDHDRLRQLHLRASTVFERTGDIATALDHAVKAEDGARVGELVSAHAGDFAHRGQFDEIRSWLALFRRDTAVRNPEAELGLAMTLAICGQTNEALKQIDYIQALDVPPPLHYAAQQARGMALMLDGRLDDLAGVAANLEAEMPDDGRAVSPFEPVRAAAHWGGVCSLMADDLAGARSSFERAAIHEPDPDVHYVDSVAFLARVACAEGDLAEAERHARTCLARNEKMAGGETSVLTCAYVALADVAWERDELSQADAMLATALRSIRPVLWEAVLVQLSSSRLLASRGKLDEAREQLIECGQTYLKPETTPTLQAMLCEMAVDFALRAGDLDDARRWVRSFTDCSQRLLAPALELRLAAIGGADDTAAEIDRALAARQPLPGEIDTLLAAAAVAGERDNKQQSLDLVARATHAAERHGFIRRFREGGPVVAAALRKLRASPPDPNYTPVASPFFLDVLAMPAANETSQPRRAGPTDALVDPLTPRETQVLELLVAGRSYTEIGDELFVSRNTIKSHVSHIYTKLGVSTRADATEVARRLGLVSAPGGRFSTVVGGGR